MDDSSLISGISNISQISKSNSSVFYKLDSTCNISDWRSIYRDNNRSFNNDSQQTELKRVSELKKINKAMNSCEESICDYAKLKLIHKCLEEIIFNDKSLIKNNTMNKLKDLLLILKIQKYMYLPNDSIELKEELTLLGIIDLPKYDFNYEEQVEIKNCLLIKLQKKIQRFIMSYVHLLGLSKEILKNNQSILCSRFYQKIELKNLHWKDKIDEVFIEYKRDLIYCLKMLHHWNNLKYKINDNNTKYIENLLLKTEIAEMKAIITKLSCTIRMYTETPVTVNAFKVLDLSIEGKIANIVQEISEKSELIKSYEVLNNTEYDEILRKYLNLCYIIKKKRNLLNNL